MRILALPFLLVATSVGAQEAPSGNYVSFEFGVGVQNAPSYFGAEDSDLAVSGAFLNPSLSIGSLAFGQGSDAYGLGATGSFRIVNERTAAANLELGGLADIDMAIEVGGGLTYSTQNSEVFAVGRYGVVGHNGWVGEIGGDYIIQPSDHVELRVGPRLFFGDDTYSNTYFGVDAAGAASLTSSSDSVVEAFDAKGGLLSRGIEVSAEYSFNDNWGLVGTVNYDTLLNDAAKSPIVQTTDQLGVSLIVTRKVTWSF